VASAATFAVGAGVPLVAALLAPESAFVLLVGGVSLACLVGLGALAAAAGGASPWIGAARVGFGGVVAMTLTAAVGRLFGATG
jgi:VIT1/CCC1 family predicted Fe2+/Mn2+ transporter